MKKTIRLTESELKHIISESTKKIVNEERNSYGHEFDNVSDDFVESLNGNYYDVYVPDWCLGYLVNGDLEGYDENEIAMMQNFEREFEGKLRGGLRVGDCCIPMDDASPSFQRDNSVGGLACDCYHFCLPAKENEELDEAVKRAIRKYLR